MGGKRKGGSWGQPHKRKGGGDETVTSTDDIASSIASEMTHVEQVPAHLLSHTDTESIVFDTQDSSSAAGTEVADTKSEPLTVGGPHSVPSVPTPGDSHHADPVVETVVESMRPGSPIPHRAQRRRCLPEPELLLLPTTSATAQHNGAIHALDGGEGVKSGEGNALAAETATAAMMEGDENSYENHDGQDLGGCIEDSIAEDEIVAIIRERFNSAATGRALARNQMDASEAPPPSPIPITLLGVGNDLRRKRIKKVSNYILGPLLGEGVYGVVRDAISMAGDTQRFRRCAVKTISLPGGSGGGLTNHSSTGNPTSAGNSNQIFRRGLTGSRMNALYQNEVNNLQRFHNPHLIRAFDIFSRHGREYVVLPIALCSLDQFVHETERGNARQRQRERWKLKQQQQQSVRPSAAEAPRRAAAGETATTQQHSHTDSGQQQSLSSPVSPSEGADVSNGHNDESNVNQPANEMDDDDGYDYDCMDDDSDSANTISTTRTIDSYGYGPHRLRGRGAGSEAGSPPLELASHPSGHWSAGGRSLLLAPGSGSGGGGGGEHRARQPVLPAILVKGIVYQLLTGVAYLHDQHIAHNDIKPSNILLFEDGTVKLTDLGSIGETFDDRGTPLFASPELCRHFFRMSGANDDGESDEQRPGNVDGGFDARVNDMWCCGLVLYYLITGKPGPLPVHIAYYKQLRERHRRRHSSNNDGGGAHGETGASDDNGDEIGGGGIARYPMNKYQLYREIAATKLPVSLGDLPDMIIEVPNATTVAGPPPAAADRPEEATSTTAEGARGGSHQYPHNSVRHLLAGLLELNPAKRLTAKGALAHQWVEMVFKPSKGHDSSSTAATAGGTNSGTAHIRKAPSKQAMDDAVHRDVARRILQTPQVKRMIRHDRVRHAQFVADCCNILNIIVPPEMIRAPGSEPFGEESHLYYSHAQQHDNRSAAIEVIRRNNSGSGAGVSGDVGGDRSVVGVIVPVGMPNRMPEGCVDPELFLPHEEEDYYERKSGRVEYDVRVLREQPLKLRQLREYLRNVVMVQCGYRTCENPSFTVMPTPSSASATRINPTRAGEGSSSGPMHGTVIRPGGAGPGETAAVVVTAMPAGGDSTPQRPSAAGTVTPTSATPHRRAVSATPPQQPPPRRRTSDFFRRGNRRPNSNSTNPENELEETAMRESSKCLCGLM